jgi:hypothetical protein
MGPPKGPEAKEGGPKEDGPMAGAPKEGGPWMKGGSMGGMMKGGFSRGPDLAKVSADPKHTRAWLREHILDPQSQKPNSRMPKFASKLSDSDLEALLDYLASLK